MADAPSPGVQAQCRAVAPERREDPRGGRARVGYSTRRRAAVEATLRGGGRGRRRDERGRRPGQRIAGGAGGWGRYRVDVRCRRRAYFGDRDEHPVRTFRTFSGDLHRVADWLEATGITTVVYWIPVFEIRETRGFEVLIVKRLSCNASCRISLRLRSLRSGVDHNLPKHKGSHFSPKYAPL